MPDVKPECKNAKEAAALCDEHGLEYIKTTAKLLGRDFKHLESVLASEDMPEDFRNDFTFCKMLSKCSSRIQEISLEHLALAYFAETSDNQSFLGAVLSAKYKELQQMTQEQRDNYIRNRELKDVQSHLSIAQSFLAHTEFVLSEETAKPELKLNDDERSRDISSIISTLRDPRSTGRALIWQNMLAQVDMLSCDIWDRTAGSITAGQPNILRKMSASARCLYLLVQFWLCTRVLELRSVVTDSDNIKDIIARYEKGLPPLPRNESISEEWLAALATAIDAYAELCGAKEPKEEPKQEQKQKSSKATPVSTSQVTAALLNPTVDIKDLEVEK